MNDIAQMVEQVEKRIAEKRARLMELLRDPDLAPYVAGLQNGHQPESAKPIAPPIGFKTGNGIREAVMNIPLSTRFTSDDVLKGLLAVGFKFSGTDQKSAVRDALYQLSRGNDAKLRMVQKGVGGKPNFYERA
jgi:hypothetical protein